MAAPDSQTSRSVPSSPASSVCSDTQLADYGSDLNRDFEYLTKIEDVLLRAVEHEEVRAAIKSFHLVHGHAPTVRQLVLALGYDQQHHEQQPPASQPGTPSAAAANRSGSDQPLAQPFLGELSPHGMVPDPGMFFGPMRHLHGSPQRGGIAGSGLLPRSPHSPHYLTRSPSRFGPVLSPIPAAQRVLQWQGSIEQQQQHDLPSQLLQEQASLDDAASAGCETPRCTSITASPARGRSPKPSPKMAARPTIPGLNLKIIKKRSPLVRTSLQSLNLAAVAAGAAAGQGPSAPSGQNPQHPAPDTSRGSPTEMLRMLLPSACKPRHSHYAHHHQHHAPTRPNAAAEQAPPPAAEVAQAREQNSYAAQWLSSAVQAEALEQQQQPQQEDATAAAKGKDGIAGALPQRGLACGSPRISMDNLDQDETGHRRATPLRAGKATPSGTPEKPPPLHLGTPGSRRRQHGEASRRSVEGLRCSEGRWGRSGSIKCGEGAEPPCWGEDGARACDGSTSPADSALHRDTSTKGSGFLAAAAAAALADGGPADEAAAVGQAAAAVVAEAPLAFSRPPPSIRRFVPPLALPTGPYAPGPGSLAARQTARAAAAAAAALAAGGAAAGSSAPPLSSRVPKLQLGRPSSRTHAFLTQQQQAQGGRTARRLSICLPSSMKFGEGPLTVRRMAAGASKGLTSHALCTVFWAEDDDDVARLYGMDGEDGDDEYDEDLDEDEDEEDDQQEDGSDEDTYLATARAFAQTFTAAANTARGLRGSLSLPQHPSPPGGSSATDGHNLLAPSSRVAKKQRRSAAARRRAAALSRERAAAAAAEREEDSDPDRCGLMLPEELWDAWERLSDGPKGRQYRMLESLTHVERITCTSYSTVSKAQREGQPVVVKIYDVAERDKLANAFAEIGVLLHLAGWQGAVKLLDYGRHEDKVMLMLESCDYSLKDWCDSQRFEVATGADYILECLRLWHTLAELMAELHERWHVAHCDLKPGNVLMVGGVLRLADFSESMLFNGKPLLLEQARGTVSYQPPEMVHGHCVDARKADVWALGCILYEMVTGEVLFKGNSDCMRAVTAAGARRTRRRHTRATASSAGGASARSEELPSAAAAAAVTDMPPPPPPSAAGGPPRVPRLPLGLAVTGRQHGTAPPPPPGVPYMSLASARSMNLGGFGTARSLELIAEGCGTEDGTSSVVTDLGGALSSRASDVWGASAANTARSTARGSATARSFAAGAASTARGGGAAAADHPTTARSLASNSTATAWPPPPPPSAGTARSVAASEWNLAAPTPAAADICNAAVGGGLFSPHSIGGDSAYQGHGGGEELPAYRRVRHSVATQCPDPAGPDWFTTKEVDDLRIMCDEAPSYYVPSPQQQLLVQEQWEQGVGTGAAAAAAVVVDGGAVDGRGTSQGGAAVDGMLYKPRLLSGKGGPTLCDDVLSLLRHVLVEDRGRPDMRRVAQLSKEVLARHAPPGFLDDSYPDATDPTTQALPQQQQQCAAAAMPPPAVPKLSLGFASDPAPAPAPAAADAIHDGGCSSGAESSAAPAAAARPRLPMLQIPGQLLAGAPVSLRSSHGAAARALSALQMQLAAEDAAELAAFTGPPTDFSIGAIEEEGLWGDSSSGGASDRPVGASGGGGGGSMDGTVAVAVAGMQQLGLGAGAGGRREMPSLFGAATAAQPVSLFDLCQPLQTARGGRPFSRSWQRFLAPGTTAGQAGSGSVWNGGSQQ